MEDILTYKQRASETYYLAEGDPSFLQVSAMRAKAGLKDEPVNLWECNLEFNSTKFVDELIERGLVEGVDFEKLITGNPDALSDDEQVALVAESDMATGSKASSRKRLALQQDNWTEVFVRALSTKGKIVFKLLKRSYSLFEFDETSS